VDEGAILIDGVDLRDYDKAYLHSSIGVVLQESFLFSGTVLENIRYSKPDASPEEVIRAAKLANAHDFIVKFPDGYDTKVGENGQNLSGGEPIILTFCILATVAFALQRLPFFKNTTKHFCATAAEPK